MTAKKQQKYVTARGSVLKRTEEELIEPNFEGLEAIDIIGVDKNAIVDRSKKPIDKTLKAKAFELYMGHHSWDEIAKETGIKRGTLLSWAGRERWGEQRKENDATTLGEVIETKKYRLNNIVMKILDGLEKAVERDAKGGFNAKNVPVYFAALGSVEKLNRLTNGLATSISEERSKRAQFTLPLEHLKQINEVKIADPFKQLEENTINVEVPPEAGREDGGETT